MMTLVQAEIRHERQQVRVSVSCSGGTFPVGRLATTMAVAVALMVPLLERARSRSANDSISMDAASGCFAHSMSSSPADLRSASVQQSSEQQGCHHGACPSVFAVLGSLVVAAHRSSKFGSTRPCDE